MTPTTHWARFRTADGRDAFGVLAGEQVAEYAGELFGASRPTGMSHALREVTLLAPCAPTKIVALWNNFTALAAKLGKPQPATPLFLLKPGSCLLGPGQAIRRPTGYAGKIVFEGELGIVIGKACRDVPPQDAAAHIFGYTCCNDVTAAQVLNENPDFTQWCRAKGYDTFGCLGPTIATHIDWSQARVVTRVDGVERQNYPLADMIFDALQLVSRISYDMTLLPGDVIACGTSVGVGSMPDGATVEVAIDGIGTLRNTLGTGGG